MGNDQPQGGYGANDRGKGFKAHSRSGITAVQMKPAGMGVRGFIQLTFAGGNETRSRFGKQSVDAAKDENSVLFTKKQQPAFEEVRTAIEVAIQGRNLGAPGMPGSSAADEIAKLVGLRDSGAISEEEFAAHKAKLLD
jgi:hypothetical protein